MYRQNSLVKIEEANPSFFSLWKDWWRSSGNRLPNERKTFEFVFPNNNSSLTKIIGYMFHNEQNKTIFDLNDRKVTLHTYSKGWIDYLEICFFDFSRKYQEKDYVSLTFENEIFVLKIIDVQNKRESIFRPPTITKLICENKFI